ncbi:MAG: GlsB/YeaQ/YmgE family stress response membrane protein [Rhodobacteraceae bacterium]|nr:GlsB/YeaQ/YmgE family stress response membrane protein [Paracoccaceae bacterium]
MGVIVYWIIIGAAAGYVGTRLLKIDLPLPQTIALGIVGALLGWLALRMVLAVLGVAAGFIGAILGVAVLVYLYKRFVEKR